MTTLDDKTIYVFVRGDLAEEQQLVQAAHAVFTMAWNHSAIWAGNNPLPLGGEPRIVALDGGYSDKAFQKTYRKLTEKLIGLVAYSDPDLPDLGMTAMVTGPLTKEQALPLANYRLRRYSPPAGASPAVDSKSSGEPVLNALVAQETEHLPLKQEVAGGIPAESSSSVNCS